MVIGILDLLKARGERLTVERFESPRGHGTFWAVVDESGDTVTMFHTEAEARKAVE